jgi:hypothetical protein
MTGISGSDRFLPYRQLMLGQWGETVALSKKGPGWVRAFR